MSCRAILIAVFACSTPVVAHAQLPPRLAEAIRLEATRPDHAFVCVGGLPPGAQEAKVPRPPRWDARGVGPLPRMGITSLDVSEDGKEIVVGTIAAFGDPNVIVLEGGKIVRHYKVGQQWIDNVAFLPGSKEVIALCTMPGGKAGDH